MRSHRQSGGGDDGSYRQWQHECQRRQSAGVRTRSRQNMQDNAAQAVEHMQSDGKDPQYCLPHWKQGETKTWCMRQLCRHDNCLLYAQHGVLPRLEGYQTIEQPVRDCAERGLVFVPPR